jgi:gliding motility-associated-like protein
MMSPARPPFRRGSLLVLACITSFSAAATHIIGGELYYDHLGGDDYQVTLKLYRDCGPNNTNGTGFDPTADIGVFDAAGNYLFSTTFTFPGAVLVPVTLSNPCLTVPPTICVEEATYTGLIELPAGTGGYTLSYQRCCRTPIIINLFAPDTQGLTCTVQVPDVPGGNSSPRFAFYPPIVMCVSEDMVFDHSATDPDGDVLVYELCTPFNGGDQFNPLPLPPFPPPYADLIWAPGYSSSYPMDALPAMAIDAVTGELTATPSLSGSYVVGVMVKEYRAGVLLSEVRRDVRMDVVPCIVSVFSAIQQQGALCTGLTIDFVNQSTGGTSWWWDFGDPLTNADTSSLPSPTYTFLDTGFYAVTLIANPGWPCADTATVIYDIHVPLEPFFTPPAITCMDRQPVNVLTTGNFTSAADVEWDLGAFGTTPTVSGNPGLLSFTQPGTNTVTVTVSQFGCDGTYTDTVTVYPNPVVIFADDTAGCTPLDVQFTDQSTAWTPFAWKWDFGDGSGSSAQHPTHLYTTSGWFDVSLEVMTSSGCIDTVLRTEPDFVQAWVQPVAGFDVTPPTVNVLEPTILVSDASTDATQWTYWIHDTLFSDPSFLYDLPDAGEYIIMQVVSTSQLCVDTAYRTVIVRDHLFYAPNAFTPDGDGINEKFLPLVIGAKEYELQIYDRWGGLAFTTTSKEEGWNGEGFPNDVYVYRALIVTFGTARKEYTGHVTIVR